MYKLLVVLLITGELFAVSCSAQDKGHALYDPSINAMHQIDSLTIVAKNQHKQVLLQIGGNWCRWCLMFNKFCENDVTVDSILKADYIVGHINYSKENPNPETMQRLGYPQRFGFPVFVILDGEGTRLHTQNSAYLEKGEGYDSKKVSEFLLQWNRKSVSGAGL
ncbi:MAG TPA: thioredoxin family protein [Bacteroidia bacterium]|nr:thioredoxin family protein [Bacteroidia bacterium]